MQAAARATAVSASNEYTCAVFSDETVKCWGYDGFGQLGNGTTTHSLTPVTVPGLTDATAVSTGGLHTCAVVAGGYL